MGMAKSADNAVTTIVPTTAGPMPGWTFVSAAFLQPLVSPPYLACAAQSPWSSPADAVFGMSLVRKLQLMTLDPFTTTVAETYTSGIAAIASEAIMAMVAMALR